MLSIATTLSRWEYYSIGIAPARKEYLVFQLLQLGWKFSGLEQIQSRRST